MFFSSAVPDAVVCMVCCISGVDVIGTFGVRRYYREIRYNLAAGVEENDAGGIRFLVNLENFVEPVLTGDLIGLWPSRCEVKYCEVPCIGDILYVQTSQN